MWYLLHDGQHELRRCFAESQSLRTVFNCARRYGKSYLFCCLAIETAIKKPKAQVRYAAPTIEMVREIIEPHMEEILADCPPSVRPTHLSSKRRWVFPNGSIIQVSGCETRKYANRLRGRACDLGIIDEAAFIDDLEYVVEDVLLAQTMNRGGRLLLGSTPSEKPAHPFQGYCERAEADGYYHKRTLNDAPHISEEEKERYIQEAGGIDASKVRREFFCEFVVDERIAVVPEWSQMQTRLDVRHPLIVTEYERPRYFQPYVSADFGFHDLTAVGFGYLDFEAQIYVQEDELIFRRQTTEPIAKAIRQRELQLWEGNELPPVRVADCPEQQRADLASFQGFGAVYGAPPGKDDKDASVAFLRTRVGQRKIRIHSRCETTIEHLQKAVWRKSGHKRSNDFDRSDDLGHFDALDQLRYVLRAIDWQANPWPVAPRLIDSEGRVIVPGVQQTGTEKLARAFAGPFRRRRHG